MPSPECHCVAQPITIPVVELMQRKSWKGGLAVHGVPQWECGCTWVEIWLNTPRRRPGHLYERDALECAWQARARFGLSELDPVTWA